MSTMSLSEIWLGPKKEVKSKRIALKFFFIYIVNRFQSFSGDIDFVQIIFPRIFLFRLLTCQHWFCSYTGIAFVKYQHCFLPNINTVFFATDFFKYRRCRHLWMKQQFMRIGHDSLEYWYFYEHNLTVEWRAHRAKLKHSALTCLTMMINLYAHTRLNLAHMSGTTEIKKRNRWIRDIK